MKLCVALLRQGSGWGADARTLPIAALSLTYFTSEHWAPVWFCITHACIIDSVLNTICIVTGCQHFTPTYYLPVPASIQPAELCQQGATLSLAYSGMWIPSTNLIS